MKKQNNRLASRLTVNHIKENDNNQSSYQADGQITSQHTEQISAGDRLKHNMNQQYNQVRFNPVDSEKSVSSIKEDIIKKKNNFKVPKLFSKKKANNQENDLEYVNDNLYSEENLEIDELKKMHEERILEKRGKFISKTVSIVLIALCIYIGFLIYGVAVTDYQYNSDGTISAQKLSVEDIKKKKNYETILVQYENCRALYEKVLMIDYRLGQGEEDPLNLAPEYEKLLDEVENLSIKTDAMTVDSQYSQIKNMLLTWIKNDIALYLQNMSAAISQNNAETANNALVDKDNVYNDFSQITSNIVATGEKLTGVDITDIKEWTPENYINKQFKGDN